LEGTDHAEGIQLEEAGMSRKVHRLAMFFAVALLLQYGESLGADWRTAISPDRREGASATRWMGSSGTAERSEQAATETQCIACPFSSTSDSALSSNGSAAFAPGLMLQITLDPARMSLHAGAIETPRFLKSK
jgi:hypothetical protein